MTMTDTATTLYSFWSSFGIPAYPEYNVPDGATMPYITYEIVEPEWRSQTNTYARVWYRDTSYVSIAATLDGISNRIGEGVLLPSGEGFILLFKDSQFIQFQPYEVDSDVKIAYLSMIMENNNK